MPSIQATPRLYPTLGSLADLLTASYSPERTQQMQGLMRFLEVPAIARTLDRISYGEPLTTGAGMTTEMRPDTKSTLLSLLGAVPVGRAVEPAAMAAGQAAERVAERVVPQVLDRGGLGREMLLGMGQGTRSYAYRPNLPSKPDPLVGTRFEREQLPGLAPRTPMNMSDLEGASLLTFPTDITSRLMRITNVSDIPINMTTEGGIPYMRDLLNMQRLAGYASNRNIARSQQNRVERAIEENLARGGSGRVFVAPHTMPIGGEDFSTMPTVGMLAIIDAVNPSKKIIEELNRRIREATVKNVKGKFKDFDGITSASGRQQLLTGEGLTGGSAGDLRKVFVDKVGSVAGQKELGYNVEDLRQAILDPFVVDQPKFSLGEGIYEAFPGELIPGMHSSYSHSMRGRYAGTLPQRPVDQVFGSLFQSLVDANRGKPGSRYKKFKDLYDAGQIKQMPAEAFADPVQLARGSLSTAGENASLFIDEKELKRLSRLFGVQ